MTDKQDPELFDDEEEGVGDESQYSVEETEVEYDHEDFELPDDFEYTEVDENGEEDEEQGAD